MPLELPPMLCTVSSSTTCLLCHSTILCPSAIVTIVQPYKKPYALYNKLDAVVAILNRCITEDVIATDGRQITGKTGMPGTSLVSKF